MKLEEFVGFIRKTETQEALAIVGSVVAISALILALWLVVLGVGFISVYAIAGNVYEDIARGNFTIAVFVVAAIVFYFIIKRFVRWVLRNPDLIKSLKDMV